MLDGALSASVGHGPAVAASPTAPGATSFREGQALEEAIRLAYPKSFKASHSLGDMVEIIANCNDFDDLHPLKTFASDLRNLNNYAKQFQHGGGPRPDHRELATYAQSALELV